MADTVIFNFSLLEFEKIDRCKKVYKEAGWKIASFFFVLKKFFSPPKSRLWSEKKKYCKKKSIIILQGGSLWVRPDAETLVPHWQKNTNTLNQATNRSLQGPQPGTKPEPWSCVCRSRGQMRSVRVNAGLELSHLLVTCWRSCPKTTHQGHGWFIGGLGSYFGLWLLVSPL